MTLDEFVGKARKHKEFWEGVRRTARVSDDLVERGRSLPGTWRLLALAEDWCTDAASTLPVLQRLVEAAPNLELRVLARDENPDLMDAHLTGTSRSIPVVILLDEEGRERGWWGPRPAVLQHWFTGEGQALTKEERNLQKRTWYARDRGVTTVREILALVEGVAATGASTSPHPTR